MHMFLAAVLAVSVAGGDGQMPADFLTTKSKSWNAWLGEEIHSPSNGVRLFPRRTPTMLDA
jgi:hypothetical protein